MWLHYNQKYFANEDIYILNNGSDDASTNNLPVEVRAVHSTKYFDHDWVVETIRNTATDLLEHDGYKYVLSTQTNEIVVPDPIIYPLGLPEYINRLIKTAVRVICYDIHQNDSLELILDLSKPILLQRRFCMRHEEYDKPLLTNMSLHWITAFHYSKEPVDREYNLLMFH